MLGVGIEEALPVGVAGAVEEDVVEVGLQLLVFFVGVGGDEEGVVAEGAGLRGVGGRRRGEGGRRRGRHG